MNFVDTHAHIDAEEFDNDRDDMIARARDAGVNKILVPAISLHTLDATIAACKRYPGYAFPMIGLHPEEVKADWRNELAKMSRILAHNDDYKFVAVGEVGLDYYWSREFEREQIEAFELQVKMAAEYRLPLMIHCRKAQNELVSVLRKYSSQLCGGVFHCFTGNEHEAAELLSFEGFMLGIGGVLTFKNSRLPETLRSVPLNRIVLETDAPYMAPTPMRGKRNESAFLRYTLQRIAECYGVEPQQIACETNANAAKVFPMCFTQHK